MIKFDAEGLQRAEIARRTGIGVASVYRVLADAKKLVLARTMAGVRRAVDRRSASLRSRHDPRSHRALGLDGNLD